MLADSRTRFDKLLRGGAVDDRRQRLDQRPPSPARTTKQGVDKSRRARGRIRQPAEGGIIKASAGGADFSLQQGNDVPVQPDGDPEELAFREAAEAALAICIKGVLTR